MITQDNVDTIEQNESHEQKDNIMSDSMSIDQDVNTTEVDVNDLVASLLGWREALSGLLEQLPADSFERLFLRLLGEDGIHDIELTGPNDAIEGIGTVGGGGFFSFRVSFKCIRGGGRVSSGEIEDFRRAVMVGRADRGLLITTGKFTQEAILKAASDRAPEIKLIDVDEFIDKLKELKLGVRSEQVLVERVVIDEEWFREIKRNT